MSLHFAVFYGSVRGERQGIKYARFMNAQLAARGHQVSFVDPLEYGLPLLDKMYKEYPAGAAPDPLPKLADIIRSAGGFMIVSGEYNHSIPPALTNLLDHSLEEWFWRPSAIACYSAGAFGGVRAAMQLRATLAELGMPSIPSIHPMPKSRISSTTTERRATRRTSVGSAASSMNSSGTRERSSGRGPRVYPY